MSANLNLTNGKRMGNVSFKNPTANAHKAFNDPKPGETFTRADVRARAKQIDRVRKQVASLKKNAPYSPALQAVEQFLRMSGMKTISSTRQIKTKHEWQLYTQFLDKFEKMKTRTVRGAKEVNKRQKEALEDIMKQAGWDPSRYNVDDFYNKLNKLDLAGIMRDFALSSDKVVAEMTVLMNQKGNRKVTAQALLTQIFGAPVTTASQSAKYNKGTKAFNQARTSRKR